MSQIDVVEHSEHNAHGHWEAPRVQTVHGEFEILTPSMNRTSFCVTPVIKILEFNALTTNLNFQLGTSIIKKSKISSHGIIYDRFIYR